MSQTDSHRDDLRSILHRASTDIQTTKELDEITADASRNLPPGATPEETYEALIQAVTARIDRHPRYKQLAAQIYLQKYYRELGVNPEDPVDYRATFKENVRRAVEAELLDERMLDHDLDSLAAAIQPERDHEFDYMALETLYQRYFLKHGDERLELPQAFWMRVAMGLALNEDHLTERAKEFYDQMSQLRFVPSTPTLFHSGTSHPQLSSCYVTTVQDDLEEIFESYKHHAVLSKWSGGLGNDWTNLRASGALIQSTGVESTGVVPFLRISNDVTAAINRSGKRRGAACAYLECWHLDFPDFIDLKRNTGDERRRTPDMNTAAWIPDLFMERVEAGGEWTLFSPDEAPDLHSTYGEEFRRKYREYEELAQQGDIRQYRVVEAQKLWRSVLERLYETGHPWITFKDPCNIRSPQDHAGTVHSSNLCTEITLNTSRDEHAVCNLGSINLTRHVGMDGLQRDKLRDTIETAMRLLDNVVDLNYYPTEEARKSNLRHRPVGLGVMGFHDALMQTRTPMNSEEAVRKANRWQEYISYHAILNSSRLARERGTYDSYEGSKWSRGLLPHDTVDLLEEERGREIPTDRSETMDWSRVREHVDTHGMRNSNTMAVAPTATISTIAGTTQSIQPVYSNLYVKSNMSGDFTVVNDRLVSDLRDRGLWNDEVVDKLKYHDGSVQEIDEIPSDLKELYRTAFEIDPRHQLRLTAHRGQWIDQSVSHNVFFPGTDGELLDEVYREAWRHGLKTTYYLRTLAASQIEKSTLDMETYGKTQKRRLESDGGLCRIEEKDCEACQ